MPAFNEAAGWRKLRPGIVDELVHASMRPPEFTGGNALTVANGAAGVDDASMRPPEFTGGNLQPRYSVYFVRDCFNEAAGIHRRKRSDEERAYIITAAT